MSEISLGLPASKEVEIEEEDQAQCLAAAHQEVALAKATLTAAELKYKKILAPIMDQINEVLGDEDSDVLADNDGTPVAQISGKRKLTSVAEQEVMLEVLGQSLFNKLAKIGVSDLRSFAPKKDLPKLLKEEYAGARTLKFL